MILPLPCCLMCLAATWVQRNTPLALTAIWASQASSLASINGSRWPPLRFDQYVHRAEFGQSDIKHLLDLVSVVTSHPTPIALPSRSMSSRADDSAPAWSRSARQHSNPRSRIGEQSPHLCLARHQSQRRLCPSTRGIWPKGVLQSKCLFILLLASQFLMV
ncbi:MAG: hypothetical protein Ct9H300mP12_09820 [Acidimicrobiales bacterium]|nr:MAG: hypothetical protein Ct9H300mP12_09820 [Acidimicrobiales bacterium]